MNDIEKANAYRDMINSPAWKDFEMFLNGEKLAAMNLAIDSDDIKVVQLNRGKVKFYDSIKTHIGYITNGPA